MGVSDNEVSPLEFAFFDMNGNINNQRVDGVHTFQTEPFAMVILFIFSPRNFRHVNSPAKAFALSGEHIRLGRWNALYRSDPLCRGPQHLHVRGQPNSWMAHSGKSQSKMDDLGVKHF